MGGIHNLSDNISIKHTVVRLNALLRCFVFICFIHSSAKSPFII